MTLFFIQDRTFNEYAIAQRVSRKVYKGVIRRMDKAGKFFHVKTYYDGHTHKTLQILPTPAGMQA